MMRSPECRMCRSGMLVASLAVLLSLPQRADAQPGRMPRQPTCGLDCLYVALHQLDVPVTVGDLRKELGTPSAEGYSLGHLADAAERRGLSTLMVSTSFANLARRPRPFAAIVSVDDQTHFLCLLDGLDRRDTVEVFDPANLAIDHGIGRFDRKVLEHRWSGETLLIAKAPLLPEERLPWSRGFWMTLIVVGLIAISLIGVAVYQKPWRR